MLYIVGGIVFSSKLELVLDVTSGNVVALEVLTRIERCNSLAYLDKYHIKNSAPSPMEHLDGVKTELEGAISMLRKMGIKIKNDIKMDYFSSTRKMIVERVIDGVKIGKSGFWHGYSPHLPMSLCGGKDSVLVEGRECALFIQL